MKCSMWGVLAQVVKKETWHVMINHSSPDHNDCSDEGDDDDDTSQSWPFATSA